MRGHSASEDARERAYDPRIHLLREKFYEDGWIAPPRQQGPILTMPITLSGGTFSALPTLLPFSLLPSRLLAST
jgi:hypothetical protein